MSKDHGHGGHSEHGHHPHQKNHGSTKRGLHKSPWAWVAVLVMIGLIFAYLASMDESESPVKGPTQTAAPAP